ncbi:MAG: DUF1642 domain-containing protein [Streptococcus sp.]|nr:DUF1642 domain-containing protein [Streptococcus sp.]
MNKQELIDYCKSLKGSLNKFINGIDVNKIIANIEQLDEPQKPVVPQFVADWIEYCKNIFLSITRALMVNEVDFYNYANQEDHSKLIIFLESEINQEKFAKAWLYGYTVKKEKRYLVKIIGITDYNSYLNYHKKENKWTIESSMDTDAIRTKHTRKELEKSGFGWVFNCPGIEIEEVEE